MSKSEAVVLLGVVEAILMDYLTLYPSDETDVRRDISRLRSLSDTRGLGFFVLDLPAAGKHFDKCLSNGEFSASGLPTQGVRWSGKALPRLFSGMLERVFSHQNMCLLPAADVTVIKFLRQIYGLAKGYKSDCSRSRTVDSIRQFFATEREIRPPSLLWDGSCIDLSGLRHLHFDDAIRLQDPALDHEFLGRGQTGDDRGVTNTLQRTADIVAAAFGAFEPSEFVPKHGPGAVSDLPPGLTKYVFPEWSEELETVFPYADMAFINYDDWVDNVGTPTRSRPSPSKLIVVPKTAKAPRLIASEPTSHQWCQQVILKYLIQGIEHGPLRFSLAIRDQTPSRSRALEGSLDGSYATIDLSEASDRISLWLVERFFRSNPGLLKAFWASRTRWIQNRLTPGLDIPTLWRVRKFTTMGSACTFPVQSIVFSTVCIALILHCEGLRPTQANVARVGKRVRVFGDDIILPTEYFERVKTLLEYLGLKVNQAKSHGKGNFREACGMDAFRGVDVTPARFNSIASTDKPSTIVAAVDCSNNFFKKGLWQTADYIKSTLPQWVVKRLPVVGHGSGMTGFISFTGSSLAGLVTRWNDKYQKEEVQVLSAISMVDRAVQTGRDDLFQRFIERPSADYVWTPGRVRKSGTYLSRRWVPSETFAVV